jgi:Fe/S biogenesis protein NfuA
MIEITPSAQQYFQRLIEQQDDPGLGLRIKVLAAGTPQADCDLQFWPLADQRADDQRVAFDGFELHVDPASVDWLQEAEIDFETEDAGGQLIIRAPRIKGQQPDGDQPLAERIAWVLDSEINPRLASHGGRVSLVEVTPELKAVLRFGGGCQGCGMVSVTLREGIEKTMAGHFPELTGILDATDHETGENPFYS